MNQIETFFDTMAERWDAVCVHDPGKIRTILDADGVSRSISERAHRWKQLNTARGYQRCVLLVF